MPFDQRISRFEEAFEIVRGLLAGERVTFHGAFHDVDDAVLLPPPARRPPLMVGGTRRACSPRACRTSTAWNTWFDELRQSRGEGFAPQLARDRRSVRARGRDPREVERSACVLVELEGGAGERRQPEAPPLPSPELEDELAALAEAGADEVILVLDPITEPSIRSLRTALPSG